MKKINLIEWLWDSHEKQSPQRFARYAAMLLMLLTLGVGQMWAGAGWWNDGGVVLKFDVNGSEVSRTLNSGSAGGTTSLGTVTTSMKLKTFTANVWKDGSGNICSANMYYRVKNSGGTVVYDKSGSATSATYKSTDGNNQVWEKSSINDDLLNGGLAPGTYTFECWFTATGNNSSSSGCGTTFWYSNNSNNYTYTFIVPSKNLTVAGAANGNTVSGSVTGITKGTAYTITATPTAGYAFNGWTKTSGGTSITIADASSATTTVTFNNYSNNATVTASFVEEETHDITVSYVNNNSQTIKNSTTESAVGVSTTRSVTAPAINDHTWASWTVGTGVKNNSANTTTNPISINSKASGSYTLQANYNLIPCSIVYKFGSGNEVFNRGGTSVITTAMSYDVASNSYYKDVTTSGTQLNFRFYYNNSKEYATAWNGDYPGVYSVTINGDQIGCTTEVQGWTNKSSIKVTYASGTTSLRVWYSKQTGKAWVTETTYSVSVASENTNRGTVNKSSVTAGRNTASASFTATPVSNSGWMFKQWSATSPASLVSSATTNPNTVKATSTGGSVQAQFKHRYILRGSTDADNNVLGGMAGWDATDNSAYASATISDGVMTITANLTKAKTKYKFKIYDLSGSSWKGQTVTTDIPDNSARTLSGSNNVTLTTTAAGTYTFVYTVSSNSIKVLFPSPVYSVTYGKQSGEGTVTAKIGTESIGATPGKAVGGSNVVMTATAGTGYEFTKWVNESGTQISTSNPYTISSIAANCTIKAVFTALNYTAVNNLKEADGTANGQYNVTYDNTSIAHTSAPSRSGYTVEGYYKQAAWTNKIANTNLSLVASTDYATSASKWKVTSAPDLYIKWQQTLTLAGNGAGSTNGSVTTTYLGTASSHTAATRTGYTLNGYYDNTSGGNKILTNTGALVSYSASVASYINSAGKWIYDGTPTLSAQWTANNYDVTLKANTGTGDDQLVQATYDVAMPLTLKNSSTAITVHTKTGYTLLGYWDDASSGNQYYSYNAGTSTLSSYRTWNKDAATNLFAHWSANTYRVTLDVDEEHKGDIASATAYQDVTYDGLTTSVPNRPTAAQGYALVGYYTDQLGEGTKVINGDGTWIASVTGYTDGSKNWIHAGDVTLYAYYKKAEITAVELNETMFDPVAAGDEGYVVANPTIAPNPTGDHIICWELLYDNDNPVTGHNAIADPDGSHPNRVKFSIAGLAAGGYKIKATLRTGSSCEGGLLSTYIAEFQIANEFTITVVYKDTEGNTIAASTTSPGKALEFTDITAPDLIGYTFSTWQLGEGMSTEEALTTKTDFSYKTTFNSTLTAEYTKKNVIYFNNTLGWEDVWVYFYTSNKYWADDYGTGAWRGQYFNGSKPYYNMHRGHMTQIEGTNIWYFDYTAKGWDGWENVAFTNMGDQTGQGASADDQAPDNDHAYFSNTIANPIQVVRRGDHKTTLPMFVPLTGQTGTLLNNNKANYVNQGYWMNYPENTGYVLHIFNSKTYGASDGLMSIPFEYTADKTMPMSLTVELAGGKEYGFEIHRADSKKYGTNTKVMKNGDSGDDGAGWALAENKRTGLLTSVAGDYTFTLNFGNRGGGYNFLAGVHYPVAANDYRVVYNDRVAWSQGTAHSASWYHPSRAINKKDGAEDIVSFYVSKEVGANASMKFQYASAVSGEGVVTWSDVDGGSISLSDITESGVYNFYLSQAAGSITVDSIRPYTGQYYIRSQAVTGGWDNYRVGSDHKMTYSEFSESAANTFGEKFSHYKAKWCPRNTNIAFTIANDYSMCITDTLKQDVGNPYSNTDADGKLNNDGNPGHDGSNAYLDPNSANVRFMWNRKTNKISRAYVASSTSSEARFLVLQGSGTANANIFDENGSALSANPPGANATLLRDDQNWIYEITVQANPSALVKLYATYNGIRQYFRGTSDPGFEKGTSAVELLGGMSSSTKYSVRVVYDFKTNRLVTAWQPTGSTEEIDGVLNINADVMVVRSHHESAQCITFANDESALKGVKTVYGVMQFNRWILNNREHPEDDIPEHCADLSAIATHHRPLAIGDQKSIYERSHYYISFPFDVKLSDVFGFGQYWNEWYIEWYDGLTRAQNGYWIDSPSNWKYVTLEEKDNFVLKANQGYILGLDMDYMQATDFSFWSNKNTTIELYFPSTVSLETLKSTQVTIPALNTIEGDPYRCTINRENGDDGDRRIKDSYWRCIGVPSFNIYNSALGDGEGNTIEWKDNYEWKEDDAAFPFIYLWNKADNTITPQATSEFSFQPMHAYLVQNGGAIVWSAVSAKPSSIVARQRNTEPEEYNWRLELQQNNQMIDRTYIRMKDLESVTDGFDFGQDMSKEFNKKRSAIFSFIGTEKVAANSMPVHTDQTTIVPLGLDIKSAGEYVISLPEGTNGVGVVLVDSITGTRTNLGLMDYEVSLTAGKIDNRFFLEISPIVQTPTDVEEVTGDGLQVTGARKVIIDQMMYIIKDGKIYDAQGRQVK